MSQEQIAGIILCIIGLGLAAKPTLVWKITESWKNGGKQRPFHPIQDGLAHRQRCSHRRGHSAIHRGFEMKG